MGWPRRAGKNAASLAQGGCAIKAGACATFMMLFEIALLIAGLHAERRAGPGAAPEGGPAAGGPPLDAPAGLPDPHSPLLHPRRLAPSARRGASGPAGPRHRDRPRL